MLNDARLFDRGGRGLGTRLWAGRQSMCTSFSTAFSSSVIDRCEAWPSYKSRTGLVGGMFFKKKSNHLQNISSSTKPHLDVANMVPGGAPSMRSWLSLTPGKIITGGTTKPEADPQPITVCVRPFSPDDIDHTVR